ncbi:hypothetical protein [Burkholderia cenocepacia]|uniref:Uncharacterized protein n=1 Tax=Burkholderia cenocepacia TaxID=95486 RepID=A0AAW4TMB2_9BURK|nr:hypothetical protein [Burkholderia cenocepacia]MCA8383181.1 hypothetical protein [Burkholderia cenocepacia]
MNERMVGVASCDHGDVVCHTHALAGIEHEQQIDFRFDEPLAIRENATRVAPDMPDVPRRNPARSVRSRNISSDSK